MGRRDVLNKISTAHKNFWTKTTSARAKRLRSEAHSYHWWGIVYQIWDNDSFIISSKLCKFPVRSVFNAGSSVSSSIWHFFHRLLSYYQKQIEPTHWQLLAANQAETSVIGTVALPDAIITRWQSIPAAVVFADQLIKWMPSGLGILVDHYLDALFSNIELHLSNSKNVPLLHHKSLLQDLLPTKSKILIGKPPLLQLFLRH